MINWSASMQQTFEYYLVDPVSWTDMQRIDTVQKCSISRDLDTDTLGSSVIDIDNITEECYVRTYLVVNQNGETAKIPLGTHLIQTPSTNLDINRSTDSLDGYTPLIELKEKMPPIGYSILKGENVMDWACRLVKENTRARIVKTDNDTKLEYNFIADTEDTWLSFNKELIGCANYHFGLDEMGSILFLPNQDTASLQPIWTYTDNNMSILHPGIMCNRDLFGVPNVVEVIYSNGLECFSARVVNDDPNSPTSTVRRGREIMYRETNPSFYGQASQEQINDYAARLLKEKSSVEYIITYTHGYCPVRLGDCIRFNCPSLKLNGVKAKVISQTIKCEPGCPVSEKAVFTRNLWG